MKFFVDMKKLLPMAGGRGFSKLSYLHWIYGRFDIIYFVVYCFEQQQEYLLLCYSFPRNMASELANV